MRTVLILARVFFLEFLRDRWLIGALVLSFVIFAISKLLGSISILQVERVIFHLSMAGIHLIGVLLAMTLGVAALKREIDKQTCLLILARPFSRAQFLMAKVLALVTLLFLYDALLGLALGFSLSSEINILSFSGILLTTWFEQCLVLIMAIFASVFMVQGSAALFAIGVMLLGQWLPDLQFFANKSQSLFFEDFATFMTFITPHFYQLNHRAVYFLEKSISEQNILWSACHFLAWVAFFVVFTNYLWRDRDLA